MKERKSYKGTLNGYWCICTDTMPEGFELQEEVTFYQADEGKVFVDDKGNTFDHVLSLEGYQEIDRPEEPKPQEEHEEEKAE